MSVYFTGESESFGGLQSESWLREWSIIFVVMIYAHFSLKHLFSFSLPTNCVPAIKTLPYVPWIPTPGSCLHRAQCVNIRRFITTSKGCKCCNSPCTSCSESGRQRKMHGLSMEESLESLNTMVFQAEKLINRVTSCPGNDKCGWKEM